MKNIKNGDHFWVLYKNQLIVMIKTGGLIYNTNDMGNCWKENEFDFISKIEKPKGYEEYNCFSDVF